MASDWDEQLAAFLRDLSDTQGELLQLLTAKQQHLLSGDAGQMQATQETERDLLDRLQACHDRRGELLEQAQTEGLPADSIRSLATALPDSTQERVLPAIASANDRGRLLRHHSLTNWVLAQRTLLHLTQLLEILATGGRPEPTYGTEASILSSGSLVDQQA